MYFNNPIERLRSEALKLTRLPRHPDSSLDARLPLLLASLIYSIYRCEHDSVYAQLTVSYPSRLDYNLTCDENGAYERVVKFKKHLKMAVGLIIEDVHSNFEAYKVTSSDKRDNVPYCKIVLKKNEE